MLVVAFFLKGMRSHGQSSFGKAHCHIGMSLNRKLCRRFCVGYL